MWPGLRHKRRDRGEGVPELVGRQTIGSGGLPAVRKELRLYRALWRYLAASWTAERAKASGREEDEQSRTN
jgi:hypothetical protein